MAITKSAKKAIKSSSKKAVFNLRRKRTLKSLTKNIDKDVREGNASKVKEQLPQIQKSIDKAAKSGVIKKNTASRRISRIVAKIKNSS